MRHSYLGFAGCLALGCLSVYPAYAENIVRAVAPIAGKPGQSTAAPVLNSCLAVRAKAPSAPSGVYSLALGGQTYPVYCDMTTDGGGWALIGRALEDNVGDWARVSSTYNWPQAPGPSLARTFRLGDSEIASIPKSAFKVVSTGYNNTRYWKGSCVYRHLVAATGDCAVSYSSERWLSSSAKGSPSSGVSMGGLHDVISGQGFFIYTSHFRNPASGWGAGNGQAANFSGTGSEGTRISLQIWAR